MKVITFGLSVSLIFCLINGEFVDNGDGSLESVADLDLPLFLKSLLRLYEADGYDKTTPINQVLISMSRHLSLSPINYHRLIRTLKATRDELKGGDESFKAINSMIWLRGHWEINQKAVITLIRKIIELSENPKAMAVGVKRLARDLARKRFPMSKGDKRVIRMADKESHLNPEDISKIQALLPSESPRVAEILISAANSLDSGLISHFDNGTDTEVIMDFVKEGIRSVTLRILEVVGQKLEDSEVKTLESEVERVFEKILDLALDRYVLGSEEPWKPEGTRMPLEPSEREPPGTLSEDAFLSRIREISAQMQDDIRQLISLSISLSVTDIHIKNVEAILTSGDHQLQKTLGTPGAPNPHIRQVLDTLQHISDNDLIRKIFDKELIEDVVLQGVEHLVGTVRAEFQKRLGPRQRDPGVQNFIGEWLAEHLEHGFRDSEDLQKMSEALAEAYESIGGDEWFWTVGDFLTRHVTWEMFRIQKTSILEVLGSLESSEASEDPSPEDQVLPYLVYLHSGFRALLNPRLAPWYQRPSFIDRFAESEVDSEDTERVLRSVVLPLLKSEEEDPGVILQALGCLGDEEELQNITQWSRETIRGTLTVTRNPQPLLRSFSDLLTTTTVSRRDLIPFLRLLIDFSRQMGGVSHVRKTLISGARLLSVASLDDAITLINRAGEAMDKVEGLSVKIEHLELIRRTLNSGPLTSRLFKLYGTTSRVPSDVFKTSRMLPRHVPLELFEELTRLLKSDEPLIRDLLKHFTSSEPKYLHIGTLKKSLARARRKSKSPEIREVLEWFQMLLDDDVALDDVELEDWLRSLASVAQETKSLLEWSRGILEMLGEPEGDWSKIREAHGHLEAFWKDLEDPEAVGPLLELLDHYSWDPELLTALQQLTEDQDVSKRSNIDFLLLIFSRYTDEAEVLVDFLKDLGIDAKAIGRMDRKTRFLDEMVAVMESAGSFTNLNRLLEFHSNVTTNHTNPRDSQRQIRDLLVYLGLNSSRPKSFSSPESIEKALKLVLPCRIFEFPGVRIEEIQELVTVYGKERVVETVARESEYGDDFGRFKELLKATMGPGRVKRFTGPFDNFSFKRVYNFGHKLHKDKPDHQKQPNAVREKRDSRQSLEEKREKRSDFFHLDPLRLQNLGHQFREPTHEETSSLDKIIQDFSNSQNNRQRRSIEGTEDQRQKPTNPTEDPNQSIFAGTGN